MRILEEFKDIKTGTTTIGIITKDAVILAADQRTTMGSIAYSDSSKKIYKVTERVGLTNAGTVGDSQMLVRFLKSHASHYETERKSEMKAKAMASLLSNVLNSNRYYPYMIQFILGGYTGDAQLFELTAFGGVLERDSYAISGSGTTFAMTVLDQNYKKGMSEEEGIKLIVNAVIASKRRDIYSGGIGVDVMVIDKDGIREVRKEKIDKIIEENKKNNNLA